MSVFRWETFRGASKEREEEVVYGDLNDLSMLTGLAHVRWARPGAVAGNSIPVAG